MPPKQRRFPLGHASCLAGRQYAPSCFKELLLHHVDPPLIGIGFSRCTPHVAMRHWRRVSRRSSPPSCEVCSHCVESAQGLQQSSWLPILWSADMRNALHAAGEALCRTASGLLADCALPLQPRRDLLLAFCHASNEKGESNLTVQDFGCLHAGVGNKTGSDPFAESQLQLLCKFADQDLAWHMIFL